VPKRDVDSVVGTYSRKSRRCGVLKSLRRHENPSGYRCPHAHEERARSFHRRIGHAIYTLANIGFTVLTPSRSLRNRSRNASLLDRIHDGKHTRDITPWSSTR